MEFKNPKFAKYRRFWLLRIIYRPRVSPPIIRRKGNIYYGPRPFKLNQF